MLKLADRSSATTTAGNTSFFTVECDWAALRRGEDVYYFQDRSRELVEAGILRPVDGPSDITEYTGQDLTGREVFVVPRLGLGDVVMTTVLIRELMRKYQDVSVHYVRWKYDVVDESNQLRCHSFPRVKDMRGKYLISFEDNCKDPLFLYENWIDGIFDRGYIYAQDADVTPMVSVDAELRQKLADELTQDRHREKPLVLLNFMAGAMSRRLPPDLVCKIVEKGRDDLQFVFINEQKGRQTAGQPPEWLEGHVLDWSHLSVSARHYVALISLLDGVITCDSSALHIAAALHLPSVCLFSTYHRKKYPYKTNVGINWDYRGRFCQAPCKLELRGNSPCPEAQIFGASYSPCLKDVPPELALDSLFEKLRPERGSSKGAHKPIECPACGGRRAEERLCSNTVRQYECTDCGLLFSETEKSLDYADAYRKKEEKTWLFGTSPYSPQQFDEHHFLEILNGKRDFPRYPFIVRVLDNLQIGHSNTLLDVGAGIGHIARYIKDNLGCRVYCSEASRSCAEFIQGKLDIPAASVTRLSELPAAFPETFDVITSFEVLEHLEDPLGLMKQMAARLAEDKGSLFFSVPNKGLDDYLRKNKARGKDDYPPHHLTLWTERALRTMCHRAGFRDVALAKMPVYPGRLFSYTAPFMTPVDLGKVFASMLPMLKEMDVFDCWFVLCKQEATGIDLHRVLHCAYVKSVFGYRSNEVIAAYGSLEDAFPASAPGKAAGDIECESLERPRGRTEGRILEGHRAGAA